MTLSQLMTSLLTSSAGTAGPNPVIGFNGHGIAVYPLSTRLQNDVLYFIGREEPGKFLYTVVPGKNEGDAAAFVGAAVPSGVFGPGFRVRRCVLDHDNAEMLRERFSFTRPVLLGPVDSFGFGDRLGIANPAHLRALAGSHMRPVLAQQSIRELERTKRTAEEVLDAATWAAFQEGYAGGFGADADHLKTTDDIDRTAAAGFTMYTFDPGGFVVDDANALPLTEVRDRAARIETGDLSLSDTIQHYAGRTIRLEPGVLLDPSDEEVARAFLKYGGVITHSVRLYRHLKERHRAVPSEVELSVDETDSPTTPFEHYFIGSELRRLGVSLVSLAPRFVGAFEKGIDYRGDITAFSVAYRLHAAIAHMIGPYKLSIHSGSDKFTVYREIGRLSLGPVHVKTAGTSYLEALRTAALVDPPLVREILDFARGLYDAEKQSYHVSARLDRVPVGSSCSAETLVSCFDDDDARQVFHVTFGKVLTSSSPDGKSRFRERLMALLDDHEALHYENLLLHFRKHLQPFDKATGDVR